MLLVQADQVHGAAGGQVHDGGGGRAGHHEGRVDFLVLQAVRAVAEALVHGADAAVGVNVISAQHVHGVEPHAGTPVADGDGLARKIRHGLDVGIGGDDLHLLHVEGGHHGEVLHLGVEEALAVKGVAHNVGLDEAQLDVPGGQVLDVGLGAAGGDGGDRDAGVIGDIAGQHAAEGIVGAGLAAGAEGQGLGIAGARAFLHGSDFLALLGEVLGRAGVIGHGGDGGGKVQIQLAALGVLLGDGGDVFKDGGGQGVDVVLGHVVPGDDHGAHGHGVGVLGHGGSAGAVGASGVGGGGGVGRGGASAAHGAVFAALRAGIAAAGGEEHGQHEDGHQQREFLFHRSSSFRDWILRGLKPTLASM